jgi:hypothetical protein
MSYIRPKAPPAQSERSPDSLVSKYREMAKDTDREREAIEWSERLIVDEFTQA